MNRNAYLCCRRLIFCFLKCFAIFFNSECMNICNDNFTYAYADFKNSSFPETHDFFFVICSKIARLVWRVMSIVSWQNESFVNSIYSRTVLMAHDQLPQSFAQVAALFILHEIGRIYTRDVWKS